MSSSERLGVVVDYPVWLPLTERWIYTQVRHLPEEIRPLVVCRSRRDPDAYSVPELFAYDEMPPLRRAAVLVRALPALGTALRRKSALLHWVARRHGARVVHSHFGYTGYASAAAVQRLGLKHIVTFYGIDMSALPRAEPRWIGRYRRLFRSVHAVLCEGPHMAREVVALGCPSDKVRVHHLGVELRGIPFVPRTLSPGEPLKVLVAAAFREKKGIPLALAVLAELRKRVPVEITLVGDAGLHPKAQAEKARILAAIENLGLAVRLTGFLPHAELLREAYRHHVFLSPSRTAADGDSEGGAPVALIEMAASGMPVVSTRHADIPEVIEDGVGGLLAAEGDVRQLVEHLHWLATHPEAWLGMAQAARRRIEREFDAERQGVRAASIYRELAG